MPKLESYMMNGVIVIANTHTHAHTHTHTHTHANTHTHTHTLPNLGIPKKNFRGDLQTQKYSMQ